MRASIFPMGLLADLGHLCAASNVGAEIETSLLPRSSALLDLFDQDVARDFALSGGDDYELCFTVPAQHLAPCRRTLPDSVVASPKLEESSKVAVSAVRDPEGRWLEPARNGWDHFGA